MDDCPPGQARYQARRNAWIAGAQHVVWEVKCYPPTEEVATAVMAGILSGEVDGAFPDPVVIAQRCCGG